MYKNRSISDNYNVILETLKPDKNMKHHDKILRADATLSLRLETSIADIHQSYLVEATLIDLKQHIYHKDLTTGKVKILLFSGLFVKFYEYGDVCMLKYGNIMVRALHPGSDHRRKKG